MAHNTITNIIHHELQKHFPTENRLCSITCRSYTIHQNPNNSKSTNIWWNDQQNTIKIRNYHTNNPPHHHPYTTHDPQDPNFNIQQIIQEIHHWLTTP